MWSKTVAASISPTSYSSPSSRLLSLPFVRRLQPVHPWSGSEPPRVLLEALVRVVPARVPGLLAVSTRWTCVPAPTPSHQSRPIFCGFDLSEQRQPRCVVPSHHPCRDPPDAVPGWSMLVLPQLLLLLRLLLLRLLLLLLLLLLPLLLLLLPSSAPVILHSKRFSS